MRFRVCFTKLRTLLDLDGIIPDDNSGSSIKALFFIDGFDLFRREWCQLHAYQNQTVSFVLPDGQQLNGDILDVDSDGALILSVAGESRRFISGEIRINV